MKADFAEAVVLQLRTGDKGESPDRGHHILGLQNRAQGDWARIHLAFNFLDNKVTEVLMCVLKVELILLMVGATEMFLSEETWREL